MYSTRPSLVATIASWFSSRKLLGVADDLGRDLELLVGAGVHEDVGAPSL